MLEDAIRVSAFIIHGDTRSFKHDISINNRSLCTNTIGLSLPLDVE